MPKVIFFPFDISLPDCQIWACVRVYKRQTRSTVQLVNVCNRCLKLSEYQLCFIILHSEFLYLQYLVWISVRAGTEGPQGPSGEQVTGMKGCLSHKNVVMRGGQIKRDVKNNTDDKLARKRKANNNQYIYYIGSLFNFVALLEKPTFNCHAVRCQY